MSEVQVTGSAEYGIPVHGRELGWAKSALQQNGVPIVQIVPIGDGVYLITVVMPVGAPPPDWRSMRTYKRPPFWARIDWGTWGGRLLVLAAIVGVAYVLLYGAPAAVASIMPDIQLPAIELPEMPEIVMPEWAPKIEMPDIGGAVESAVDSAMAPVRKAVDTTIQIVTGLLTFAVGLVVLWLLFTFRGTLGGIAGGVAGAVRRGKK